MAPGADPGEDWSFEKFYTFRTSCSRVSPKTTINPFPSRRRKQKWQALRICCRSCKCNGSRGTRRLSLCWTRHWSFTYICSCFLSGRRRSGDRSATKDGKDHWRFVTILVHYWLRRILLYYVLFVKRCKEIKRIRVLLISSLLSLLLHLSQKK